jgi:hypothetical protein
MRRIRTGLRGVVVLSACLATTMCQGCVRVRESAGETRVGTHFTGRLVDTKQQPISGARLHIFGALGGKGAAQPGQKPLSREMAKTDANGAFEFKNITPGTYSLQFYWQRQNAQGHLYLDAQKFWVVVQPADVTIVVPALEDKPVEGYVRDAQGRGIAGVEVSAMGWRDYSRSSTTTDGSGHYRIQGIAGTIADTIGFRHENYSDVTLKNIPVGTTNADVVMR